jgi:hypothetical protein
MTTKAAPKTKRPEKRTIAEKDKAVTSEDRLKKMFEKMTPAERKKQLAQCQKWTRDLSLTAEAAESDLLRWLLVISVEFAKKYYPTATSSGFYISEDHDDGKRNRNVYSACISVPLSPESAPVAAPPAGSDSPNLMLWWAATVAAVNEIVADAFAIVKTMEKVEPAPIDLDGFTTSRFPSTT